MRIVDKSQVKLPPVEKLVPGDIFKYKGLFYRKLSSRDFTDVDLDYVPVYNISLNEVDGIVTDSHPDELFKNCELIIQ